MKHLDPNDPRFTAKALGEEETQDINPDANKEFNSLQSFADTLRDELKSRDESEVLTSEQKERVRSAVQTKQKKVLRFPVWINAVAACLVLGLVGIVSLKTVDNHDTPIVQGEQEIRLDLPMKPESSEHIPLRRSTPEEGTLIEAEIAELDARSRPAQLLSPTPSAFQEKLPQLETQFEHTNRQNNPVIFAAQDFYQLPTEVAVEDSPKFGLPDSNQVFEPEQEPLISQPSLDLAGASITAITEEYLEDVGTSSGSSSRMQAKENKLTKSPATPSPIAFTNNFVDTKNSSERDRNAQLIEDRLAIPIERRAHVSGGSTVTINLNPPPKQEPWNREAYGRLVENSFKNPSDHPLSTFSIDVDTASYANMRRFLNNGQLPPADAVRIEEMINYFSYDYEGPTDETPFAVHVESASAPWNEDHRLVRIALQGEKIDLSERPDANLVFLIDVSGSMSNQNKLPLVQRSLNLLVDQMEARDSISVVVYAGASGLALPSTTANNKETIQHAISNLQSGGSTNGGAGIELAYSVAQKHFVEDGINRVILCTDGDFNVGTTDRGSLTRMIEEKAKTGVFFSVLGFGMGNYQDASMEELSNKGNGNYGYLDSFKEARKVFVDDMLGTLYTIAKDVKIQVEFNPTQVGSYRLIGYENRMLAKEDFNDDTKDAGEIGAGHRVTALYEIVPPGIAEGKTSSVDPLKYQAATEPSAKSAELLTVKLRYKQPDEDVSSLIEHPFIDNGSELESTNADFRFATAVASFGMLLRQSERIAEMNLEDVLSIATKSKGNDSGGLRSEFIELVEKAISLQPKTGETQE